MNWLLLKNSLLVAGLTTLLSVAFGFVGAIWLASLSKGWRVGILALAIIALALPPFLLTLNNFAVPAILQIKGFPAEIWVRFNTSFDTFGALKVSWPLLLAPLLLLAWMSWREFPWPRLQGPVASSLVRRQLGRPWFW